MVMDLNLRCNSLKCRAQLNDRAIVTTCSHIFCSSCADSLGFSDASGVARVCPACETHLTNPDDAVITQLNPSEEYKTSVLSGLSPSVIMECAGRGLAFYSYQTTQEILYQEFLAKSLTDKYATLSTDMDRIIHDANSEILGLRDKLAALQIEQRNSEQRNQELTEAFREKSKSQQQILRLYQSLKAQVMSSQVQSAASHDAEQTLRSATGERFVDHVDTYRDAQRHVPPFSLGRGPSRSHSAHRKEADNPWNNQAQVRSEYQTFEHPISATPSQHRTRLPVPLRHERVSGTLHPGTGVAHRGTPLTRQPLKSINPNVFSGNGASVYNSQAGNKLGKSISFGRVAR